ncbi:MAG TPA: hypothetical protein PLF81_16475 [Candidatus Anammoximicrobium sp.]|nr:hypothetical protein [Candidatus Anammoximicrobium sp.]
MTAEPTRPAPSPPADRCVEVIAPCRLHFGLLSFGQPSGRQFGGAGVMVDHPAVHLRVSAADAFQATGPRAGRARGFARRWAEHVGLPREPVCRIEILSMAPAHAGLGAGTQLALSVAAGLNAWCGRPQPTPEELALSVGRGQRSAVGTYGFAAGGLIVENGKLPSEPISPLECRLPLPEAWRFLLIQPPAAAGLSGSAEQTAFDQLPPVPEEVTRQLQDELHLQMLPAVREADFARFSDSVYRYGRLAGLCFAAVQGGPYNGPRLSAIVDLIRALGVTGVGQSSWGPTLFALLPGEQEARKLVANLAEQLAREEVQLTIRRPNNRGAEIVVSE